MHYEIDKDEHHQDRESYRLTYLSLNPFIKDIQGKLVAHAYNPKKRGPKKRSSKMVFTWEIILFLFKILIKDMVNLLQYILIEYMLKLSWEYIRSKNLIRFVF